MRPTEREWWYLAGLVATDGCLIRGGRAVVLVAKDREYLEMIRRRCRITNTTGRHPNGRGQLSHHLWISDREFWMDLHGIGLTPKKSKTIGPLAVPDRMFAAFLRGVIDGDGSIRRWRHPTNGGEQWSLRIYSASPAFLDWLRAAIHRIYGATGRTHASKPSVGVLKFGKMAAQRILRACYDGDGPALERKRSLARQCVDTPSGWRRSRTTGQVAKLANAADSVRVSPEATPG